jgi:hypothetical protein
MAARNLAKSQRECSSRVPERGIFPAVLAWFRFVGWARLAASDDEVACCFEIAWFVVSVIVRA